MNGRLGVLKADKDFDEWDRQLRETLNERGFDKAFLERTYNPTDEESENFWTLLEPRFQSPLLSKPCVQRHEGERNGREAYFEYRELRDCVLLGRGGHAKCNPSNMRFRNLVSTWFDQPRPNDVYAFLRETQRP